jgi:hypothetical protein
MDALTPDQIDAAFRVVVGVPARAADQQLLAAMGATVPDLAQYLWDHWLGEPDDDEDWSIQTVETVIKEAIRGQR